METIKQYTVENNNFKNLSTYAPQLLRWGILVSQKHWLNNSTYLGLSLFSLCLSKSRPLSFPSLGFSSILSFTLYFSLYFFPRMISSSIGGGGLGVRGPFFLLWLLFEVLKVHKATVRGLYFWNPTWMILKCVLKSSNILFNYLPFYYAV